MFAPKNFGFLQGYFRSFPNDFYYKNKRMRERERERERAHRFSRPILYVLVILHEKNPYSYGDGGDVSSNEFKIPLHCVCLEFASTFCEMVK